jgi:hypothetical protein
MIKQDTLRKAFVAPTSLSNTPVPISKLGSYIAQYVDFRLRKVTLLWWIAAIIEARLQDVGISPFNGDMLIPWAMFLKEIGNPLDVHWISENTWSCVTTNPKAMKASVRYLPPSPIYRRAVDGIYDGAEWGAIVHRRYIEMVATEVSCNLPSSSFSSC